MHPSPVVRSALLAALISLGAACEGAGPFTAESASNETPGFAAAEGVVVGRVQSVEPSEGTLTLSGDVRIQLTAFTSIDKGGDFSSLVEVLAAIQAGTTVLCEAEGFLEAGVLIAQRIRFVEEDPGDSADRSSIEMDGQVSSVASGAQSFRIVGGLTVQLEAATELESDDECGCKDLEDVQRGLQAGLTVRAEIRGRIEDGVLFASRVRFEVVRDANGEEEDGGDEKKDVVAGIVASVDLLARTCRTTDGKVIGIVSDSIIDLAGDLHTLADVELRLTLGGRVRVEAEGKKTATALVASRVKFEVDP